MHIKSRNPISG